MAKENSSIVAFNRGVISPLGLARVDLNRYKMSAERQANFVPRVLGSMMLRPGLGYQNRTQSDNRARYIPFVFSSTEMYLIEATDSTLRFFSVDSTTGDLTLLTQPGYGVGGGNSPLTGITNPNFDTNLTGWTNADEAGATSAWATGGYMSLAGTGSNSAIRKQTIGVNAPYAGRAVRLRIIVHRGPVTFRAGSADGLSDCFPESQLDTGYHSLVMTGFGPSGLFVKFSNASATAALVDSINIETIGTMSLPSHWTAGLIDNIRWAQSADVVFLSDGNAMQQKIERRQNDSWSITNYETSNGPFRVINTGPITLTPSAITGDITLTASAALFDPLHVGALFRISSIGQSVTAALGGANQFSSYIVVTGVSTGRSFSLIITGTFSATLTLQYSVGVAGSWIDKSTYTTATSTSINDGYDNQIIYYRIGIKAGDYVSGTANIQLIFAAGSITGVARITGYTSSTSVSAAVLTALGGTTASLYWYEGEWSDYRGWPSAVALHEGRLWWAGKSKIFGSVSDSYYNFDDNTVGDSAPISRTIGEGPVDTINWMCTLTRLLMGTSSNSANIPPVTVDGNAILAARSSSLDEPLTVTNFNLKKIATSAFFTDRSLRRIFEATFDPKWYDYATNDLNSATPDFHSSGVTRIYAQMKPDVRLHVIRGDGTVGLMVFDKVENVNCWITIETQGIIEDVVTLPGAEEDFVYYQVQRTFDGVNIRTIEKWAKESECTGLPISKTADCYYYGGPASIYPTCTVQLPSFMANTEVVIWSAGMLPDASYTGVLVNGLIPFTVTLPDGSTQYVGKYLGTATSDSSGLVTVANANIAYSGLTVGVAYTAQFKSLKQAFAAAMGTPLNQPKRINSLGVVLANAHCQALKYGKDFNNLDDMPMTESGMDVDQNTVWSQYDEQSFEFAGDWSTDSRLCLQVTAPLPCTILAATVQMVLNDKG